MAIPRMLTGFVSQSTTPYNLKLPWQTSEQDGMFTMNYKIEDSVRDNVVAWAKTNWGERPRRFRFGLDARRYLFEPAEVAQAALKANAQSQLPELFPFLTIDKLEVSISDDEKAGGNVIIFRLESHFRDNEDRKIVVDELVGT